MTTDFQIMPIPYATVQHLFYLNKNTLAKKGMLKLIVDEYPGFPCRASLEDAQLGEEVLLLPYTHHDVDSPYRSSGAIFIRKNAKTAKPSVNSIPNFLIHRQLSIRGYNETGMMIDAKTIQGQKLRATLNELFQNPALSYIQIHNSGPGCFNCQVNRVDA